ncbi:ABC transporter substrate-binding protein [Microbacterium sp. W4I20]|uniref:ABC transporter substrate-binding protein n=1 Tax=Microbacterium sp. W4I20 TaxID=3042262 RepID=UPI00277F585F|nr:ABC transporter substrate-binding protein [Microbacterium sp. W4I20]MDQ0728211.1 peptide/nickel transport system substrate-binding protein [Microbacterium sp. W4I20]
MTPKRTAVTAVVAVTALIAALAGCAPAGEGGGGGGELVEGGTFTTILGSDPGSLDPQLSAGSALFDISKLAYDTLVSIDAKGEVRSQLASEWNVDGTTATLKINEGITCGDGSEFTAQTAADNLNWISDPANESGFLGAFLPVGVTSVAEGDTVTMTLASPAPFLLLGLGGLPMVCGSSLTERDGLAAGTDGTGPYVLTEAVPSDHYTYELREDYAWGPGGATVDEKGIPAKVNVRVVADGTTAANLLLSGEANAAQLTGPDADRAISADLFTREATAIAGEQWYNHADGHPTSDPAVRLALTQAVDLDELANVLTAGKGGRATALAVVEPTVCSYDAIEGSLPEFDVDAANATLDEAGWVRGADGVREKDGTRLSLTFLYENSLGAAAAAAAELALAAWDEIGAEVEGKQQDETALLEATFGTGAWDIGWLTLSVNSPDQAIGFVSGTVPPEGSNFSAIENEEYTAAVAEASLMDGSEGCDTWNEAESALFAAADMVPFANATVYMFGNGAEFEWLGVIEPTSVRLVG